MNGFKDGKTTIQHCIDTFTKELERAQRKFLENKNMNEDKLAHGYDMMVIVYEHVIECLRMGQTNLTRLENKQQMDDNVVNIHEQTMEFMINSLTKK
jgi:hypothetical protein|tara:strand:- start:334 stop:624 length:291 start_codon:yes stop_codon:yes gene_type:complete